MSRAELMNDYEAIQHRLIRLSNQPTWGLELEAELDLIIEKMTEFHSKLFPITYTPTDQKKITDYFTPLIQPLPKKPYQTTLIEWDTEDEKMLEERRVNPPAFEPTVPRCVTPPICDMEHTD